jgi:hypothetical protein
MCTPAITGWLSLAGRHSWPSQASHQRLAIADLPLFCLAIIGWQLLAGHHWLVSTGWPSSGRPSKAGNHWLVITD